MYDLYIAWLQEQRAGQDNASEGKIDPEAQRAIQQVVLDLCARAHASGTSNEACLCCKWGRECAHKSYVVSCLPACLCTI